jgi:GT2 family glycosyltransferase/SAM-dependent methyltransferase
MSTPILPCAYDEHYYQSHCGPIPYSREQAWWKVFFSGVAERLILSLTPRRVLDAGCAMGFLVESFWDRGVECLGIDISEYAISQVRPDIATFCRVGSITDPISGSFDLVVCVEVLEHLTPDDARLAIANITSVTDTILFSSTPTDLAEPTHVNVRPTLAWLRSFAEYGFVPDLLYDASFVAPHAILFRRSQVPLSDDVMMLFAALIAQRIGTQEKSTRVGELERVTEGLREELRQRLEAHEAFERLRTNEESRREHFDRRLELLTTETMVQLRQLRSSQEQTSAAMMNVREQLERCERRVTQIYESRIWRSLVRLGGLVDQTLGRVAGGRIGTTRQTVTVASVARTSAGGMQSHAEREFDGDRMYVHIEVPCASSRVFPDAILHITGWAIAETGIARVEAWLDSDGPHEATYGLMRPDILEQYPTIAEAGHSGFSHYRFLKSDDAGNHRIRIRAVSKSGCELEAATTFKVETRSLYEVWADLHSPTPEGLKRMQFECRSFSYQPKISIVTPVYRTPLEFLKKCAASVRKQVYGNWEWILVDDHSCDDRLTAILEEYSADPRIRVHRLPANNGIAGATNTGLPLCTGDFVAFLDHDDEISPDALYEVVRLLNADRAIDVFYSDEDKLGENGRRRDGLFKPAWSPDLLRSMNYVCHFLVCRRDLLNETGGVRPGFDGSQDYDLILRLSERTNRIERIPKVLYHWRIHPDSTAMSTTQKPKASEAGRRAIEDQLHRLNVPGHVEEVGVCRYRVRYRIDGEPEVAIVIPAGGNERLRTAIQSVIRKSTYKTFRIVVVDNSSGANVRRWTEASARDARVDWMDCRDKPFNFSALCNSAAAFVDSKYLLFLNDDTEVMTPDWIESLLEHAQRPEVGAVGAQLLFPNNTIQHAGVVLGIFGVAGHAFRGLDPGMPHYLNLSQHVRNCSAVTGACLLTRREVFDSVGRFDELNLPTCFQDVDLCLKMVDAGFSVVYTPYARLYHYESATKRTIARTDEIDYMEKRWSRYIAQDPFYNPNLTRHSDLYQLDLNTPATLS